MKAVVQPRYGGLDVLRIENIDTPVAGAGQVLVRVHASSVNSADWDYVRGMPLIRMAAPRRPSHRIPGSDIAGTVSEVGPSATRFEPGERVFADLTEDGFGAFAEYVAVREAALTPMPSGLTFEEAAAVPSAAVIALQGIRAKRDLEAGDRVLINGAGGGMGTFAIQLAKTCGAHVTAVDRLEKLELLRSLGADEVIDYETDDFTTSGERYDLVLDLSGYRAPFDYRRTLRPRGRYLLVGGSIRRILHAALVGPLRSRTSETSMGILLGRPNDPALMASVVELLEAGVIRPFIDRSYPLDQAAEAMRVIAEGRSLGKVVIRVAEDPTTPA